MSPAFSNARNDIRLFSSGSASGLPGRLRKNEHHRLQEIKSLFGEIVYVCHLGRLLDDYQNPPITD
jgi:hypothetical protein